MYRYKYIDALGFCLVGLIEWSCVRPGILANST